MKGPSKWFLFNIIMVLPCIHTSPIEVSTLYGDVIGNLKLYRYASFQGIPFASPPVGELRLKPPIDPSPWAKPLDVSGNSTKVCPQLSGTTSGDVIGEEDCLYLNIYSPALAKGTLTLSFEYFLHHIILVILCIRSKYITCFYF